MRLLTLVVEWFDSFVPVPSILGVRYTRLAHLVPPADFFGQFSQVVILKAIEASDTALGGLASWDGVVVFLGELPDSSVVSPQRCRPALTVLHSLET
jgi:hypothetical protein